MKEKRSARLKRATVFWVVGMTSGQSTAVTRTLRGALREGDAPDAGAGGEVEDSGWVGRRG